MWLKTLEDRMKKSVAKINNMFFKHLIIHGYMSILQKSRTLEKNMCFVQIFITDIEYFPLFLSNSMQFMLKSTGKSPLHLLS